MAPRFSHYPHPLEDWDFLARMRSGKLKMKAPNTANRHAVMLADDENPAIHLQNQSIPLDEDRARLSLRPEIRLAGKWSAHFLDKLYGHPQHFRAPDHIPGCHVIGLFNGDLIIDAISTKRPGEMHYTFDRTSKMLQKVTGISMRGGWKESPIQLGKLPGFERFRLEDHETLDEEMEDIAPGVNKQEGGAAEQHRIELTIDENNEPVALARIAENGTVEKEVDRTTYQAHNLLGLITAKKGADSDDSNATIDLQDKGTSNEDSNATIDLIQDHAPSEADTIEDPDLTDKEDWPSSYPRGHQKPHPPSKEALEERARAEYHAKLDQVAERERRHQIRAIERAATMAAEAVMASYAANSSKAAVEAANNAGETDTVGDHTRDLEINVGESMDIDDSNAAIGLTQDMDGLEMTANMPQAPNSADNLTKSPIHPQILPDPGTPLSDRLGTSMELEINRVTQRQPQYSPQQLEQIRQIEEAAVNAAQASPTILHANPRRSEQRFIDKAAAVAAQIALEMHGRLVRFEAGEAARSNVAGLDEEL